MRRRQPLKTARSTKRLTPVAARWHHESPLTPRPAAAIATCAAGTFRRRHQRPNFLQQHKILCRPLQVIQSSVQVQLITQQLTDRKLAPAYKNNGCHV